jgi:hypothetical protein
LKVPHAKVIRWELCPRIKKTNFGLLSFWVVFSFAQSKPIRAGRSIFEKIINLQLISILIIVAFVRVALIDFRIPSASGNGTVMAIGKK